MEDNLQRPSKGLYQDSSLYDQPKGTYRFALNSVNETELGDVNFVGNEESNEICDSLTPGYIPIGKVYMGDNETVIFSVSEVGGISEIGLLDDACRYTPIVNDEASSLEDKLNFKVTHQIQGTYRLRLGCERTVYFVDGDNNRPRYFNFNSLTDFQNTDNTWNANLFNLQKSYSKIPSFQNTEVLDSGGNLEPGGYNIAIQYVDDSLNPTEWVTTSPTIKIYNSLSIEEYREINGSINSDVDFLNFPITSKAIKVTLSNLDKDFLYYRLAFIESNNGSGQISGVKYTDVIPTSKDFFIYTGNNTISQGTEAEILQFSNIIYTSGSIEQIENRLLLANTQGKQVNFCNLQSYASKVKADCITKTVILDNLDDPSNPKNPTHEFGGKGYMPGEIYSFGIVYIFADGSTSPVYHIPGKAPNVNSNTVFSPDDNVFPMSNENQGSSIYTDNENCSATNYWGRDSEGVALTGKNIRHHRFPLRSDIGKPLVSDVIGNEQSVDFYNLVLNIQGDLITPIAPAELPSFEVRVSYTVDGQNYFFFENISPAFYADESGAFTLNVSENSQFHSSNIFTNIVIEMTDINGNISTPVAEWSNYFTDPYIVDTSISTSVQPFTSTTQGKTYTTDILGIKFSGVTIPSLDDTNGEEVIGYYIVRNERTEFDKTILDTGVLIPSVVNSKYISHGLLQPEGANTSDTVYGLIHPEHKFNDREYFVYDEIIQQGNFNITDRKYGKVNYDDVFDGSSYNAEVQKGGNDDGGAVDGSPESKGFDGWSFNIISRDTIVSHESKNTFNFGSADIKEKFYLDALGNRPINDNADEVYNISADNKIGIIQLEDGVTIPDNNNLPYVVLKKQNLDSYSNFRVLPYYKETTNPFYFTSGDTAVAFGGDSYVSPMRYVNSMYWDNRVAKRAGQTSVFKIILGAILVIIGTILAIPSGGSSTLIVGAGIALVGAGALAVNAGIKQDNFNKAYSDEYDKGLRQTVLDDWVDTFYNYTSSVGNYFSNPWTGQLQWIFEHAKNGPSDDTIQWIGDCVTDLWFETSVNTALRTNIQSTVSPFINTPGLIESGNDSGIKLWEFFGIHYADSNQNRHPISSLERHLVSKLLAFDPNRDDNRFYIGIALGEYYGINPDYVRYNKQKIYTHLALEYDCCSECQEDFPHRISYSEQSFQEELSDNYRVFLPNNYRDIQGETGEITNVFKIGNNLFIHTYEGLWQMPRNYQERITDQIVSFIGTGSYFEIPPQKVLDDDTGSSAGLQHKWSAIKTPQGYFFVCENQRKIYQFNGRTLTPISSNGLENWFKENTRLKVDEDYYESKGERYLYRDNPSNPYGSGFISTYDTKKERLLFTKKDFQYAPGVIDGTDFEICADNGVVTLFEDFSQIIADEALDDWTYIGLENCRMKFEKTTLSTIQEEREVITNIPNTADIHVFYDTSGSFDQPALDQIDAVIDEWVITFATENPDWTGQVYKYNDATERWVNYAQIIGSTTYSGQNLATKDIIVLSFCNESQPVYHESSLETVIANPTTQFIDDYDAFVGTNLGGNNPTNSSLYNIYNSFIGINYPIVFTTLAASKNFVLHSLAAGRGVPYTNAETVALIPNPGMSTGEWSTLTGALEGTNPYPDDGLENYNWVIKEDRYKDAMGNVIDSSQFQEDIAEILEGNISSEITLVDVIVETKEIKYIDGVIIDDPVQLDNSWTLSYGLQTNKRKASWVSWHSYLPNFYINVPEKHYSWIYGNNNIWKHNVKGNYQTYYGVYHPHILEYVSLSNPVITRLWNHIRLLTEAKMFDTETQQYFEERFRTFNKAIVYNNRQCSGEMSLIVKDTQSGQADYLLNQVVNPNDNTIIIDRNERDWTLNDFRDIRIDYNAPIWNSNINSLQDEYYIDKILNSSTLDTSKDWTQLESFRDKYLAIRLIFDNFADTKLLTNYSVENEQQSFR